MRACQGVVEQAAAGQGKKANTLGEGEEASEPGGLLLEGEEQEYFLELLMRRASPERPKANPSVKGKTAPAKGKKNRSKGKKAHGKGLAERTANERMKEERATDSAGGLEKQPAPDPANNPEAKNRGLAESNQQEKEQVTGTHTTSGGECSGQKTPDYPWGRLSEARALGVLGIWRGEGLGKGWVRAGQFTSNLRLRWTDPLTARRVPSK